MLTDVEEQYSPDGESKSPQVPLGLRTPLETDGQQVAKHNTAHLKEGNHNNSNL